MKEDGGNSVPEETSPPADSESPVREESTQAEEQLAAEGSSEPEPHTNETHHAEESPMELPFDSTEDQGREEPVSEAKHEEQVSELLVQGKL